MRTRITTLAITLSLIVVLYVIGYLSHPKAVQAFTLIESPGIVFAPTVVYQGQHVRMCANNFFGDGSVRWQLEFRSHDNANRLLLSSGFVTLAPQAGACLEADVADLLRTSPAAVNGDGKVGLIGLLRAERGSFSGGIRSFPLTSFQTCPANIAGITDGTSQCSTMLPAVQDQGLLLPAILPQ